MTKSWKVMTTSILSKSDSYTGIEFTDVLQAKEFIECVNQGRYYNEADVMYYIHPVHLDKYYKGKVI